MVTTLVVAGGLLIGALAVIIGLMHRYFWDAYDALRVIGTEADWED